MEIESKTTVAWDPNIVSLIKARVVHPEILVDRARAIDAPLFGP